MFGITFFTRHDRDTLSGLAKLLVNINQKVETMSQIIEGLTAKVSELENVVDSARAGFEGLKAALDDAIAANDPAALQALSDRLGAQVEELSQAVAANTIAEDEDPAG